MNGNSRLSEPTVEEKKKTKQKNPQNPKTPTQTNQPKKPKHFPLQKPQQSYSSLLSRTLPHTHTEIC